MNSNIKPSDLNNLAADCMSLVGDLIHTQHLITDMHDRISELGIDSKIGENETDVAYLRRIAVYATEWEHDLMTDKAIECVLRPRSFLGRIFAKLAQAIG